MLNFTLENISAEDIDGVKTCAAGHLADEEGVTVEAEGVFILPRRARDRSD
jgi:hypothetical protein